MNNVVPAHNADLGQQQQGNGDHRCCRCVDRVQFLFGSPEDQQEDGDNQQLHFIDTDLTHFFQQPGNCFFTAFDFVDFRRHQVHHQLIQANGHQQ